jgi:hypothetical protein
MGAPVQIPAPVIQVPGSKNAIPAPAGLLSHGSPAPTGQVPAYLWVPAHAR